MDGTVMSAIVPCVDLRCRATCEARLVWLSSDGLQRARCGPRTLRRMSQPTWAQRERQELCRLLEEVGPDAPTLCGDWTTRDLAAHLIVRESRPDAAAGIVFKPMAQWTDRIQDKAATRPWSQMIQTIRTGPPKLSVFSLPKADAMANTTEYFVHIEDVRRAEPEWEPRKLPSKFSDSLWKITSSRARGFYRHVPVGVILERTDGAADSPTEANSAKAASGSPTVTVSGPAQELLLFSFGRKDYAVVDIAGDRKSIDALMAAKMSV